jgi:hypothetical protein
MYTHVSKCKNDKRTEKKRNKFIYMETYICFPFFTTFIAIMECLYFYEVIVILNFIIKLH